MGVRPNINQKMIDTANERWDKAIGRIYGLWLVGVMIGAVHIKMEKFGAAGFEFTIEKPEAVQGMMFLTCFAYYLFLIGTAILFVIQYTTTNRHILRRVIYVALGTKKTLKGKDPDQIVVLKKVAKATYGFFMLIVVIAAMLPAIHIVIFEREPVKQAASLFFN